MWFAYLLPFGAYAHHCCTSERLVVLRDHTNRVCGVAVTVCRREKGTRWFGRKLDSEDDREHLGEACRKARRRPTCAWGRPEAIHGVTRSGAWPLRGIPCEGLQRGLGEACALLDTLVKIPESSTGVCISLPCSLTSAFTLIVLLLFAVEIATH